LGDLQTGVGRIAPAVVEEIADVVSLKDIDESLILRSALFETF
jgi:hypothetical protein